MSSPASAREVSEETSARGISAATAAASGAPEPAPPETAAAAESIAPDTPPRRVLTPVEEAFRELMAVTQDVVSWSIGGVFGVAFAHAIPAAGGTLPEEDARFVSALMHFVKLSKHLYYGHTVMPLLDGEGDDARYTDRTIGVFNTGMPIAQALALMEAVGVPPRKYFQAVAAIDGPAPARAVPPEEWPADWKVPEPSTAAAVGGGGAAGGAGATLAS